MNPSISGPTTSTATRLHKDRETGAPRSLRLGRGRGRPKARSLEGAGTSWCIGRLAGVPIRIHITFPLLLIWVGVTQYELRKEWADVFAGFGFTLVVFAIVVLHEMGHALMAKRYGIRTLEITLLPIGGEARLERMPRRPWQELWISLAGPAVNVGLAAFAFSLIAVLGQPVDLIPTTGRASVLTGFAWLNVGMAAFNLLPAFPMDGGRVLRALLAMVVDYDRATASAAFVAQGVAVAIGIAGLAVNPVLVLIAIFVWFAAHDERQLVRLRTMMAGVTVSRAMATDFRCLSPDDTLRTAMAIAPACHQRHFPVKSGEAVIGVLRWEDLLGGLAVSGPDGRVGDSMLRTTAMVRWDETVEHALSRIDHDHLRALPVMRDGKLVGLITEENLVDCLMLEKAVGAEARAAGRPDSVGADGR